MPTDDSWWPFWKAPDQASAWQNVKNLFKFTKGDVIPGSPAWANSFAFADYFTKTRGWAARIDLDPKDPGSAYAAGANIGDVIVYDWKGNGDSRDGHVAIVTGFDGTRVIVSQQGLGPDENQIARAWDFSTLYNAPLFEGSPDMRAWLLQWANNARG